MLAAMLVLRFIARAAGLAFLAAAFIAAAFEITAHGLTGERSLVMSAWQVAYIHWPDVLIQARILVEDRFGPEIWVAWIIPVLSVPGWVLFGAPGIAFLWLSRYRRRAGEEDDEHEQSLYLYDELAKAARADGYVETDEDLYTDVARDIRAGWRAEGHPNPDELHDDKDATPPHRPPPTEFGRR